MISNLLDDPTVDSRHSQSLRDARSILFAAIDGSTDSYLSAVTGISRQLISSELVQSVSSTSKSKLSTIGKKTLKKKEPSKYIKGKSQTYKLAFPESQPSLPFKSKSIAKQFLGKPIPNAS